MASTTLVVPSLIHRPATAGATYWGPGDLYRFLVTGEETGGAYFAMEALVPPGGGPPPHPRPRGRDVLRARGPRRLPPRRRARHRRPRRLRQRPARPRAQLPQRGRELARLILTFTPAGIEHFFEETLERALDPTPAAARQRRRGRRPLRRGGAALRDGVPGLNPGSARGQRRLDARAARPRRHVERAAEQQHALAHPRQAEARAGRGRVEAAAVVGDAQAQRAVGRRAPRPPRALAPACLTALVSASWMIR